MDLLNKEEITHLFLLLLAKNSRQVEMEYSKKSGKYMVWRLERPPEADEAVESTRIPLALVDSFAEAQEVAWQWIQGEEE